MRRANFIFWISFMVLVVDRYNCNEVESIQRRDYLDLPDLSELHSESSADEELQRVVKEMVAKVDISTLEPDEAARKIGELASKQRQELEGNESLGTSWEILEKLSNYKTTSCSSELIFATRHFLAGIEDDLTYAKLKPLLKHIVPELFSRCAREITEGDRKYKSFPIDEANNLRTLLREATGGKGIGPYLQPILRKINLPETAGNLSLVAMLQVIARKYGIPRRRKDYIGSIEKIWDRYCADIHSDDYYDNFEIINLANAFGPAFELNVLLAQLSEFHRICTDWRREGVHDRTLVLWRQKAGELKESEDSSEDEEAEDSTNWWKFW